MKWVLRYLKGTASVGLVFGGSTGQLEGAVGYVDSNYVGCLLSLVVL